MIHFFSQKRGAEERKCFLRATILCIYNWLIYKWKIVFASKMFIIIIYKQHVDIIMLVTEAS